MSKVFSFLLFLVSSFPALAQWQPVSNPLPVGVELQGCQLDAVSRQTAWFTNTFLYVSPFTVQVSRTIDGGQTWQNVTPAAPTTGRYVGSVIEAFDDQHAWVILERTNTAGNSPNQELHYTADGGVSWSIRPLPTVPPWQNTLRFFSVTEGLLLDQTAGVLYRTTNGGLSWQQQSNAPTLTAGQKTSGLRQVGGLLWVTVYDAQSKPVGFWASTDRGLTWNIQALPTTAAAYREVIFRDPQHAILPSTQSGLLTSADGGSTWQNATAPPVSAGILTPVPGARAYVAGAVFHTGSMADVRGSAITYDDGQTWTILENNNGYLTIQFTAPDAGWYIQSTIVPAVEDFQYEGIGRYAGSPLTSRATKTQVIAADVFPNPSTTGNFTVQLPATAGPVSAVRVLDALGRAVYQAASLPAGQHLDLSRQPKGVYSLEVQTSTGVVRRRLLVE